MIRPPLLKPLDKAVIVSPAGKIDEDIIDKAAVILREWGLKVEAVSYTHLDRYNYYI